MQALVHSLAGTIGLSSFTTVGLLYVGHGVRAMWSQRQRRAQARRRRAASPVAIMAAHQAFVAEVERRLAVQGGGLACRTDRTWHRSPAAGQPGRLTAALWYDRQLNLPYRPAHPLWRRALRRIVWGTTRPESEQRTQARARRAVPGVVTRPARFYDAGRAS